jgi:hypothetical protein
MAGRLWDVELARARARHAWLVALLAPSRRQAAGWTVSDFWQQQAPWSGLACYDELTREVARQAYQQAVAASPAPRLVVFLDQLPEVAVSRLASRWGQPPPQQLAQHVRRYCHQLRRQMRTAGQGPVLTLAGDQQQALAELQAAIDAMSGAGEA